MALTKCEECSGQVSDKAAACPHCGAPINEDDVGDEASGDDQEHDDEEDQEEPVDDQAEERASRGSEIAAGASGVKPSSTLNKTLLVVAGAMALALGVVAYSDATKPPSGSDKPPSPSDLCAALAQKRIVDKCEDFKGPMPRPTTGHTVGSINFAGERAYTLEMITFDSEEDLEATQLAIKKSLRAGQLEAEKLNLIPSPDPQFIRSNRRHLLCVIGSTDKDMAEGASEKMRKARGFLQKQ